MLSSENLQSRDYIISEEQIIPVKNLRPPNFIVESSWSEQDEKHYFVRDPKSTNNNGKLFMIDYSFIHISDNLTR